MQRDSACHFSYPEADLEGLRNQSLEFLDSHGLPVTPLSFAVAYDYTARRTSGLYKELDKELMRGRVLDEHLVRALFDRFFLADQDAGLDSHMADIHSVLYRVLQDMAKAGKGLCDFGEVLESQLSELNASPGVEAVQGIARNLAMATEKAMASNKDLRLSLRQTQQESEQLRKELVQLREDADTDGLTGLLTRKAFDRMLEEQFGRARGRHATLALLMLDIDHFKKFNDTYGHPLGDEVIRSVAAAVRKHVRGTDLAARYGGEEFVVLLPDTDLIGALTVAGTVHRAVSRLSLVRKSTRERLPEITVSVGVASLNGEDDAESLLNRADQALYTAKRSGRNRVVSERSIVGSDDAKSA